MATTVEVDVHLSNKLWARAAVPSGASTGIYEALELRDGGSDYLGKGVSKAVSNVNTIIGPALICKDPTDQTGIDNFMVQQLDGTQNEWGWCKQKIGANAILAVSLAVCKAGAAVLNIPLYKSTLLTWPVTRSWCCLFLPSMSSMVDHMLGTNLLCGNL